jgi:hypothetical protein
MKTTYKIKDLQLIHSIPVGEYFYHTRYKRVYRKEKKSNIFGYCVCGDVVTGENIKISDSQIGVVIQGTLSSEVADYINFHNYFKVTEKEEAEEEKVELTNEEIKFLKKAIEISKK